MDDVLKKNLITELGIDRLPEDQQAEALLRMGDIIFHAVLLRVLDVLDENGRKEMEIFLAEPKNQNDPDAFYKFLGTKVPDLDKIVEEEVAVFKRDALGTMGGIG